MVQMESQKFNWAYYFVLIFTDGIGSTGNVHYQPVVAYICYRRALCYSNTRLSAVWCVCVNSKQTVV